MEDRDSIKKRKIAELRKKYENLAFRTAGFAADEVRIADKIETNTARKSSRPEGD